MGSSRRPAGTGTIAIVLAVLASSGTESVEANDLVISEFMAVNSTTLVDEDGDSSDWLEVHNQGFEPVDLDGHYLTDDPDVLRKWRFPALVLDGGARVLVFASGNDRRLAGSELHTNFRLRSTGEYLALVAPDGETVIHEYAPYPKQRPDLSYGIGQDLDVDALVPGLTVARILVPQEGSLGTSWTGGAEPFDDSGWIDGTTGVGYVSSQPGFSVRTILASVPVCSLAVAQDVLRNPAAQAQVSAEIAQVLDYHNTGGQGHYTGNNPFPGTVVGEDVNNFVVEARATVTVPAAGAWTFGVSSDDGFGLDVTGNGESFRLEFPSPRGPGDSLAVFNFSRAGDYDLRLVFYECGGGSEVELFAA
ncbi:MAG: lamin tail domain-containing protein, partial [Planctomycetota bacterium]|nr:lamin tail domain-containing protein [Planctomycetota bacterium]